MRYDFAPLEGLTDSIYRRLHHQYFPGIDRYFMPFISPTTHRCLTRREQRDLPPASSQPLTAVPQILTKSPEDFLWAQAQCGALGYKEVNLNLGCPSGTVVSKGKGSGMLADLPALDAFLQEIFSRTKGPISAKTRLGIHDPAEFPAVLEVLNRYPFTELIIHPRVRKDFYKGPIRMALFQYGLEHSRCPVTYNGDLCALSDIEALSAQFPGLQAVMLGRALIGNPGLLTPGGTRRDTLTAFHDQLLEAYCVAFGSPHNAMFRLKENWRYLLCLFEESEKLGKRLRKTTDLQEYRNITRQILTELPMRPQPEPDWLGKSLANSSGF